jgi:hypothetical protein
VGLFNKTFIWDTLIITGLCLHLPFKEPTVSKKIHYFIFAVYHIFNPKFVHIDLIVPLSIYGNCSLRSVYLFMRDAYLSVSQLLFIESPLSVFVLVNIKLVDYLILKNSTCKSCRLTL